MSGWRPDWASVGQAQRRTAASGPQPDAAKIVRAPGPSGELRGRTQRHHALQALVHDAGSRRRPAPHYKLPAIDSCGTFPFRSQPSRGESRGGSRGRRGKAPPRPSARSRGNARLAHCPCTHSRNLNTEKPTNENARAAAGATIAATFAPKPTFPSFHTPPKRLSPPPFLPTQFQGRPIQCSDATSEGSGDCEGTDCQFG